MTAHCPRCQHSLTLTQRTFFCPQCATHYPAQACCPQCQQPVEVLKACGAVDYFCQQHGLLSKSAVIFRWPDSE